MLQPTPTLPIPGQKVDPNYSLTIGFGGIVQAKFVCIPSADVGKEIPVYNLIDYSNLIATYSDSTSKQGYIIVTSTSLVDASPVLVSSTATQSGVGPNGNYTIYQAYPCFIDYPINVNNVLISRCSAVGSLSCTLVYNIIIRLMTVQYQYPASFTQEELFEDLKTLPETVITELKKLDCEKMQSALGLLKSFNDAKLVS